MRKVVGIDRKIKRAWLDAALDRLGQAGDENELRTFLDRQLREELPSKASRAKSVGIVLRIWGNVSRERLALRDRAVALLPRISGQERIWLHWGMTALAYPFFRDAAEAVGRLLTLQDDFTTAQAQGRLLTAWGDRATTREAAQKLLTTLVDWEVLRSTKAKGHFLLARKMMASDPDLQLWLVEALLGANPADEIEAQQLLRLPESFPFTLNVGMADLRKHGRFNIHRQGLDMNMVSLVVSKPEPPLKRKRTSKAATKTPTRAPDLFADHGGVVKTSGNGEARPAPKRGAAAAKTAEPTPGASPSGETERTRIQETLKRELVRPLAARSVEVAQGPGAPPVAQRPFGVTAAECTKEFENGHLYACIALTQGVIEAVVCHARLGSLRPSGTAQDVRFEADLEVLHENGSLSATLKAKLWQGWADRLACYALDASVDADRRRLVEIARKKLALLKELDDAVCGRSQEQVMSGPKE